MPREFPLRGDRPDLGSSEESDIDAAHRTNGNPEMMRHVGDGGAVIGRDSGELLGDAGMEVTDGGVGLGYTRKL